MRRKDILEEAKYVNVLINKSNSEQLKRRDNRRIKRFINRIFNGNIQYENGDEYTECKIENDDIVFFQVKKTEEQYSPYSYEDNDFILDVQFRALKYLERIKYDDNNTIRFEFISYVIIIAVLGMLQMIFTIKSRSNFQMITYVVFFLLTIKSLYVVNMTYDEMKESKEVL